MATVKKLITALTILFSLQVSASLYSTHPTLDSNIKDNGITLIPLLTTELNNVDSISIKYVIQHEYHRDLSVFLIHPTGKRIALSEQVDEGYKYEVTKFFSSRYSPKLFKDIYKLKANGQWYLKIVDHAPNDVGTFIEYDINISGDSTEGGSNGNHPVPTNPETPVVVTPTNPTSPITGYSNLKCSDVWNKILSEGSLEEAYSSLVNLCGDEFRSALKQVISKNRNLGYTGARHLMFSKIDNFKGTVCGVYSDTCLETDQIPTPKIMNCEHTWPQSKGAVGAAKSDLHHLYPADADINSMRGNYPFCEVKTVTKKGKFSKLGTLPGIGKCFEPKSDHKGNVARSMLYFAVRYGHQIDQSQESFLRKWLLEDAVNETEKIRNNKIEEYQGNRNPFVDHPEFSYLISNF